MENSADVKMKLKLVKKIKLEGTIEALTGLHIGGSAQGLEIGGVDNPIIRDPLSNQPYIPGSSLKGKMRSLLEKNYGIAEDETKFTKDGVWIDPDVNITKVFGLPAEISDKKKKPSSRLIVRDAFLTDDSEKALFQSPFTDAPYTEIKTEIVVDRVTAAANPRPLERVPKGAKFKFELILNIFNDDNENEFIDLIKQGIALLNDDYLGGSGTRGSGKVKMELSEKFKQKSAEDYQKLNGWQDYSTQN